MSITFRKFSASARLSQETTAYDTQVLFNKKLIGSCSNEGRGGMGHFHPEAGVDANLVRQAETWASQQPVLELDGTPMSYDGKTLYHGGVADYCDSLADKTLEIQQLRASLRRLLKSNVLFTSEGTKGRGIFQVKRPWTKDFEPHLRSKHPDAVILNDLPFKVALEIFEEQTRPPKASPSVKAPRP